MKFTHILVLLTFIVSGNAYSKLNGKNVVLVHGLQTSHLTGAPNVSPGLNTGARAPKLYCTGRLMIG